MKIHEILETRDTINEYSLSDLGSDIASGARAVGRGVKTAATAAHDVVWPELSSNPAVQSKYRQKQRNRYARAKRFATLGKFANFLHKTVLWASVADPVLVYLDNMNNAQDYVEAGKWDQTTYDQVQKDETSRLLAKIAIAIAGIAAGLLARRAVTTFGLIKPVMNFLLGNKTTDTVLKYVDEAGVAYFMHWLSTPDGAKSVTDLVNVKFVQDAGDSVGPVLQAIEDKFNQYLSKIGVDIEGAVSGTVGKVAQLPKTAMGVLPYPELNKPAATGAASTPSATTSSTSNTAPTGKVSTASIPKASTPLSKYAVDGKGTEEKPKDGKAEPKVDSANAINDAPNWAKPPEDLSKWEYHKPGWIRNKETGEIKYGTKS